MSPQSRTTSTRLHVIVAAGVASVSLFGHGVLPASSQVVTGTVLGTVQDSSGQILPGVDVTVTLTERGLTRTTVTNEARGVRVRLSAGRDLPRQRVTGWFQGPGPGQRGPAAGPAAACRLRPRDWASDRGSHRHRPGPAHCVRFVEPRRGRRARASRDDSGPRPSVRRPRRTVGWRHTRGRAARSADSSRWPATPSTSTGTVRTRTTSCSTACRSTTACGAGWRCRHRSTPSRK